MFTKRHHEKIAQTLKDNKPIQDDIDSYTIYIGARVQWQNTVMTFAFLFQSDNPRFDRDRFLAACGYND